MAIPITPICRTIPNIHDSSRRTAIVDITETYMVNFTSPAARSPLLSAPAQGYAAAFKMPMEALVQMGSAINPNIDGLLSFVILAVAPFNLLKGILVSALVFLLYKPLSRLIHSKI